MAADTKRAVLRVDARQYRFLEQEFVVPASGEHVWTLEEMKTLLACQGLHVVTAADKAVLDAVRTATDIWQSGQSFDWIRVCAAEFARREEAAK